MEEEEDEEGGKGGGAKEEVEDRSRDELPAYRLFLLRFIKSVKNAWRSSVFLGSSVVSGLVGSGEEPYACRSCYVVSRLS